MIRRRVRSPLGLALILCLYAASSSAWPQNLLRDPGFEGVRDNRFEQWKTPSGQPGALTVARNQTRGGIHCAVLQAMPRNGESWGRVLNSARFEVTQGVRYRYTVWARGGGRLVLGGVEYREKDGEETPVLCGPAVTLTTDWREVTAYYVPSDPKVARFSAAVEVHGLQATTALDDAVFEVCPVPGYSLSLTQEHTMAPQGGKVSIKIKAGGPTGKAPVALLLVERFPDQTRRSRKLKPRKAGEFAYEFRADGATGVHGITCVLEKGGVAETSYVDVVDPPVYEQFAVAAAAIRLKVPAHLCFVGDSLTAFYRGYNYVDKIRGWLEQKYGAKVRVTNAGVGGDYTTRVLARLDAAVLRLEPTHVFIFLGHNDSKLKSASDYREAYVAQEVFEQEYREIVRRIQRVGGARVTVLSATSSVYEITQATAEKARAQGREHNLFGKPEALEAFNATARKVATEFGVGYLDVYEPTRTHPDKKLLFTSDGVHLSNEGNRLIALEVLKYLARP